MRDINDQSANWIDVENLFFDRVLKREENFLPGLRPLSMSRNAAPAHPGRQADASGIDYQDALFDASKSMIRFKKPNHLVKMIARIINSRIGVTHCAVMIYDSSVRAYVLTGSKGEDGKRIPAGYIKLDLKNSLIELFADKRNDYFSRDGVISLKELKWVLESGQLMARDVCLHNKLRSAIKEMELLDADVCVPCFFKKELLGILILGKKTSGRNFIRAEINLFATLANDVAIALANARLIEGLQKKVDQVKHLCEREHQLFLNTAVALAKTIDARDINTRGHTARVTEFCLSIESALTDMPEAKPGSSFSELLYMTALLHDIGKIGIPDRILHKKSGLNAAERKIVEKHPEIGASILLPVRELNEVTKCVRAHQEWYNGNGYPDGLKKDEIPLAARMVSVADAFDAMTSNRPYRKKMSPGEAVKEIKECSGTQFDPNVVDSFLKSCRIEKDGERGAIFRLTKGFLCAK